MRYGLVFIRGLVIVVAMGATPVRAQVPFKAEIAGGWSSPVTPSSFTDAWNGSAALSVALHFRPNARLGAWAEVGWFRHRFDTEAYEKSIAATFPGVNVSGNDLQVVPITAGIEWSLTSWGNTRPFVSVGLGYDWISGTDPRASGPGANNVTFPAPPGDAFGTQVGLGVWTLVTPTVALFADVGYRVAWTSPDALGFVPVRIGVRF